MSLVSINPATEELIKEYEEFSDHQISSALEASAEAYKGWRQTSYETRAKVLNNAADILIKNKHEYASMMTAEMGKPISSSIAEVEKCAWVCSYYAEHAEAFLADEFISTEYKVSKVVFRPLGTVLAIMPWNFPFWQVFRFAAPALMAGNTALLKHASNVTGSALMIQEIFEQAGLIEGGFITLPIGSSKVAQIIESDAVKAVTLTGSEQAGSKVASKAGEMLKKSVLELGGSDPYLVLKDADLVKAAESIVTSRMINNGQSCIAAKRFIVDSEVYNGFLEEVKKLMAEYEMNDPMDPGCRLGPMARKDLRDELHQQVQESIAKGAELIMGGVVPEKKGAWYPPTIISNVKPGMPAYHDELFGPVAIMIKVEDVDEAITIANDTRFGLGAAVFTSDDTKGEELAENFIEAGACFVNDFVKSDPRLPFGGIKASGFGRELGTFGIREFVNIKTIVITKPS